MCGPCPCSAFAALAPPALVSALQWPPFPLPVVTCYRLLPERCSVGPFGSACAPRGFSRPSCTVSFAPRRVLCAARRPAAMSVPWFRSCSFSPLLLGYPLFPCSPVRAHCPPTPGLFRSFFVRGSPAISFGANVVSARYCVVFSACVISLGAFFCLLVWVPAVSFFGFPLAGSFPRVFSSGAVWAGFFGLHDATFLPGRRSLGSLRRASPRACGSLLRVACARSGRVLALGFVSCSLLAFRCFPPPRWVSPRPSASFARCRTFFSRFDLRARCAFAAGLVAFFSARAASAAHCAAVYAPFGFTLAPRLLPRFFPSFCRRPSPAWTPPGAPALLCCAPPSFSVLFHSPGACPVF